jgi:hypothetical protein
MSLPWSSLLVVLSVVVFVAFLSWKLRPAVSLSAAAWGKLFGLRQRKGPRTAELDDEVRRARARARAARTPRERAQALTAAGAASARSDDGMTAALGLYLRAVRADATDPAPLAGIIELLHDERPDLLETVLWRRLALLPWTGETAGSARCAVDGLVQLYRRDLPHRERARALVKLRALIAE